MNIKKRIAVWCALFALLVALVPPFNAMAEETVDVEALCMEACGKLLEDSSMVLLLTERPHYAVGYNYAKKRVEIIVADSNQTVNNLRYIYSGIYLCNGSSNKMGVLYYYNGSEWVYGTSGAVGIDGSGNNVPYIVASNYESIVGLSLSELIPSVYEYVLGYNFVDWCADAGLKVCASSNESASVIPYSYNDYWHIVRKTASGKWLLTTIGSTEGQSKMSLRLSENMGSVKIYEYSGTDSFWISVRQYVYDTDGWRLISFDTYGYEDFALGLLTLEAGTGIDQTKVLAYTNTDIYTSDGTEVYMASSAEYVEPTTPDIDVPSEEITPSPTTAPSGGRIGGGTRPEVTPAVSAGQATVVSGRTGIYEEPSTASQLQHYLYSGALVYVVDELENGWYYVRYEVGGLSQVGYVYSENIDYSSENGYASDIVGGEVVEKVEEMLGMVKVVPVMISVLFSFLPPWCLAVVGVGFSLLIALMIYKCVRG